MPILNNEIISYNLIYTGRRETLIEDFLANNITQYIFLNDLLSVIYVDENFNEDTLKNISQIVWWENACSMSSLINITDNLSQGQNALEAAGISLQGDGQIGRAHV